MSEACRKLRGCFGAVVRVFGQRICDARSGECYGRAFIVPWRGRVHLIGYDGEVPVVPVFLPNDKTEYWRQTLGFVAHEEVDFERVSGK